MKYLLYLLFTISVYTAYANEKKPGAGIIKADPSIPVHFSNYNSFLQGFKPDFAIAVFRQPKNYRKTADSTRALFEIFSTYISSYRYSKINFINDADLNKKLLEKLVTMNEVAYYRLFYKNAGGTFYKYQDISAKRNLLKEAVLTDPVLLAIEIQKFNESGSLRSRTQYLQVMPDSLEKRKGDFDTVWYDLRPKLLKSGKEEIYYNNQKLLYSRVYQNGVLKDSIYHELFSDGAVRKQYATKNGLIHGLVKTFDARGNLIEELEFQQGKLVRTIRVNKNFDSRKKAFLFAIDQFDKPANITNEIRTSGFRFDWKSLDGCVNDVDSLGVVLVSRNGFHPKQVTSVTNELATKAGFIKALQQFSASVKKGDIIFMHFSGHGQLFVTEDSLRKYAGLAIPCRDVNYPSDTSLANANYIYQYQLEEFFNKIKKQIGKTGQLVISIDVSHSGQLLSYGEAEEEPSKGKMAIARRGESNNILFNLVKDDSAPVVIYTGTSSTEYGYEMRGENGKSYGAYSLALASALASPLSMNSADLHEEVLSFLKKNGKKQTPGYLASQAQILFDNFEMEEDKGLLTLPALKPSGNTFLLSAGITAYAASENQTLSFKNCASDARRYASFFESQFREVNGENGKKKLFSSLLIDQEATRENILAAINNAISNSKPEDYFIFNFSGYCKPLKDSSGKQVTYFVPYSVQSISDTAAIRKNGLPLTQLKDLLQMIPANNQLFITEAGSTDDFQKEFIQALIETSPSIASLSNKNRIFIVPNGSGLDNFICNGVGQEQGPISYFITHLSRDLNLYGIFEGGIYADAVKFNLNKTAVECDYFRTGYFDIFFERDFVKDLHDYLPEEVMQSRGAGVTNKTKAAVAGAIAKKYSLLVGTNAYNGKPQWTDLQEIPILDVTSIGAELKNNYGFEVNYLIDKPSDSIYAAMLRLSAILQPNDQLIIYVAGHGDYDEQLFDDGFIVCANSRPVKEDPYRNSYIQYSKLSRMINKLPARQVMMVLDVCFGGSFAEKVVRCVNRSDYKDLSSASYVAEKLKLKTRLFLSSGGKREVPNGYKGRLSPFAQRFLQCLQTKGGDGKLLSSANFYEFVKKLPSGPVIGSFGDDECGSEFLILAN